MNSISQAFSSVCRILGQAIAWLVLTTAITTLVVVVLRYGLNLGWVALQEAITYQHAYVLILYAALAFAKDEHVRVDIFYREWSAKGKARLNFAGNLLLLFPFCLTLIVFSFDYVAESWALFEGSKEAGGLPLVFLLKSLIPALAITMMLQGISSSVENWKTMNSTKTE